MKKRLVSHLVLGLSLAALPFLGGCTQQNPGSSNPFLGTANAQPADNDTHLAPVTAAATNMPAAASVPAETNAPAAAQTNAPALAEATAPEPAPVTELKPPPNVRLSPVLSEVVKLVQSGVEETVLRSYITNTTGYFALGADEIVYLNDLGVAGDLITTMIQHDQALRELRANAAKEALGAIPAPPKPEPEPEPEVAAAPSYIEAPAMEAEPVYVSNNYFYDTLAPYGSWVYVTGYGRCWRPTVAARNSYWRPYGDRGRWVYSDCGWYWLSDYSWGATTFHYGRWFNDTRWGWCWWPDTVWAPSWVSWRYTADYCGWAPLPPTACYEPGFGMMYQNGSVGISFGFGLGASAYAFVPWGSFCGPRPYQHYAPASRAVHLYNNSTPVTHLEAGGRGRVHNRGIAPERVREHSRTEVRTVSIREQNSRGSRAERLDRDGRTLAVHRPNLVPATGSGESNLEPRGRNVERNSSRRGNETVISGSPVTPGSISPAAFGRTEVRTERARSTPSRRVDEPTVPQVPTSSTVVETEPSIPTPARVETRPVREREPRVETQIANRPRPVSPVVVRTPEVSPQPVTPPAPAPRVEQPRVTQSTPRPAAPSSSVVVIGSRNGARSTGRDYSVYSTPSPSPAPGTPTSPPRDNFAPRSTPSPIVSAPEVSDNSPAPTRAQTERSRSTRNESVRSESRGSYSTYSTPQAGQVITPAARPTPSPNFTPRPAQSSPAPGFTPPPQPSAPPSPSPARVETRSTPAAPTTVPATSRPGSPSQGRPNR